MIGNVDIGRDFEDAHLAAAWTPRCNRCPILRALDAVTVAAMADTPADGCADDLVVIAAVKHRGGIVTIRWADGIHAT